MLEESLALHRALDDTRSVAICLHNLGYCAYLNGDVRRAATFYEESLALFRELDDPGDIALCLQQMGKLACQRGEIELASDLLSDALRRFHELGNDVVVPSLLESLAESALRGGRFERALTLFAAAAALRERMRTPVSALYRRQLDRSLDEARLELDERVGERAWRRGGSMSLDEAKRYALDTPEGE